MFSKIRKSIAQFIAPSSINVDVPAGTKSLTVSAAPAHILSQYVRQHDTTPLVGNFHVSHLDDLGSDYLKAAICNLGAWSALARGFSEYERVASKRSANNEKLASLMDEFHCWNAQLPEDKQMEDDAVLLAVEKLSNVRPVKGNEQTDKIIARVRKCTIEDVCKDRVERAAKQSAARAELILGFCQSVWSCGSSGDMNPSIDSNKVAAKAIQTIEWVATNWSGEPAGIAAELLLIEADIAKIEKLARDSESKSDDTFIDGTLTTDGLVRNAKLSRRLGEETQDLTPKAREMVRVRKQG